MNRAILYIHGKGGNAQEVESYRPLCPGCEILGAEYDGSYPWLAQDGIRQAYDALRQTCDTITLLGNSVGCYFAMLALQTCAVDRALFLAPILDMELLIHDMMGWAGVTEESLQRQGVIPVAFGEPLSWEYLQYVRGHPIDWRTPTHILYPARDHLTPREAAESFAASHTGSLTILENAEHYLHTPEEAAFIQKWIHKYL